MNDIPPSFDSFWVFPNDKRAKKLFSALLFDEFCRCFYLVCSLNVYSATFTMSVFPLANPVLIATKLSFAVVVAISFPTILYTLTVVPLARPLMMTVPPWHRTDRAGAASVKTPDSFFCTVTLHVAASPLLSFAVAVMVAIPAAIAFTFQVESTVAILSSLLLHVTEWSVAYLGAVTAVNTMESPSRSVCSAVLSVRLVSGSSVRLMVRMH